MPSISGTQDANSAKPVCGIIMPIAAMLPRYEASHWSDVRKVFDAAIHKAGMTPQIVSDSFESDVIQQRIISNLYYNPVVICDVSGLNPNVMFELGMRITFKQPVIIVTDDFASIPFDTKVIEHLGYPRDLHIHQANEFIEKLAVRIKQLHDQKEGGTFRSFIEAFGTFEVLEPTKKVVEADQLILDRLDMLDRSIGRIVEHENLYRNTLLHSRRLPTNELRVHFGRDTPDAAVEMVIDVLRILIPQTRIDSVRGPKGQAIISADLGSASEEDRSRLEMRLRKMVASDVLSSMDIKWS